MVVRAMAVRAMVVAVMVEVMVAEEINSCLLPGLRDHELTHLQQVRGG